MCFRINVKRNNMKIISILAIFYNKTEILISNIVRKIKIGLIPLAFIYYMKG